MKKIVALFLLLYLSLVAVAAFAGPGTPLVTERAGVPVQGPAPSPLTTYLISDNYSHTTPLYPDVLWFSLNYNGTGTCQVRIMNTMTKASWAAIPVFSQGSYSRVVHPKSLYLNYSGCGGISGANSVLETM